MQKSAAIVSYITVCSFVAVSILRRLSARRLPRSRQFEWVQTQLRSGWPQNADELVDVFCVIRLSPEQLRELLPMLWSQRLMNVDGKSALAVRRIFRVLSTRFGRLLFDYCMATDAVLLPPFLLEVVAMHPFTREQGRRMAPVLSSLLRGMLSTNDTSEVTDAVAHMSQVLASDDQLEVTRALHTSGCTRLLVNYAMEHEQVAAPCLALLVSFSRVHDALQFMCASSEFVSWLHSTLLRADAPLQNKLEAISLLVTLSNDCRVAMLSLSVFEALVCGPGSALRAESAKGLVHICQQHRPVTLGFLFRSLDACLAATFSGNDEAAVALFEIGLCIDDMDVLREAICGIRVENVLLSCMACAGSERPLAQKAAFVLARCFTGSLLTLDLTQRAVEFLHDGDARLRSCATYMLENIATNAELLAPSIVVSALLSLLAQADTAFDAAVTMSSQLQRADVQQYLSSQRHHLRFLLSVLTGVEDARLPLLNGLQLALHPPSALASAVVAEGGLSSLATLLYLVNVQVVSAAALCLLNASAAGTADAAVRFDNALVHALEHALRLPDATVVKYAAGTLSNLAKRDVALHARLRTDGVLDTLVELLLGAPDCALYAAQCLATLAATADNDAYITRLLDSRPQALQRFLDRDSA